MRAEALTKCKIFPKSNFQITYNPGIPITAEIPNTSFIHQFMTQQWDTRYSKYANLTDNHLFKIQMSVKVINQYAQYVFENAFNQSKNYYY